MVALLALLLASPARADIPPEDGSGDCKCSSTTPAALASPLLAVALLAAASRRSRPPTT